MATAANSPVDARVTAVICNYNGEKYLRDLLNSIERQTVRPAEILIVDNASTDGSAAVAREFAGVRWIVMEKNDGPCPARNRGMQEARTPLVLALDCDIILAPDCLEQLLNIINSDARIAVVSPRAVAEEDTNLVQYDGAFFHYVGLLSLRNFYVPLDRAAGRGAVDVDAYVSMAVLVNCKECLDAGGYDPVFFILFEDSDLSYRLRSSGARIVCAEEARVIHRGGTAGTSFRAGLYPARRVFLHTRNRCLFIIKNYQFITILRGLPGLILYEFVALIFAFAKLAPHAWLHGKASFLYYLPGALAARRSTRARRTIPDRDFVRGGPLTLWPALTASPAARTLGGALDAILQFSWRALGGRS